MNLFIVLILIALISKTFANDFKLTLTEAASLLDNYGASKGLQDDMKIFRRASDKAVYIYVNNYGNKYFIRAQVAAMKMDTVFGNFKLADGQTRITYSEAYRSDPGYDQWIYNDPSLAMYFYIPFSDNSNWGYTNFKKPGYLGTTRDFYYGINWVDKARYASGVSPFNKWNVPAFRSQKGLSWEYDANGYSKVKSQGVCADLGRHMVTCHHGGTCINDSTKSSGYRCDCGPFWSGTTCTVEGGTQAPAALACSFDPCNGRGTCEDSGSSDSSNVVCTCYSGFGGDNCETVIDNCGGVDCNTGSCVNTINGYKCDCPAGKTGDHCESNGCDTNPCKNFGVCTNEKGAGDRQYKCDCAATAFKGVVCHKARDNCDLAHNGGKKEDLCLNGSTCVAKGGNGITCECTLAYYGQYCDQKAAKVKKVEFPLKLRNFINDKAPTLQKVVYDKNKFPDLSELRVRTTAISVLTLYKMPGGAASDWSGKKKRAFVNNVLSIANRRSATYNTVLSLSNLVLQFEKKYQGSRRRSLLTTDLGEDHATITWSYNSTYDDDVLEVVDVLTNGLNNSALAESLNDDPDFDDTIPLSGDSLDEDVGDLTLTAIEIVEDFDTLGSVNISTYEPPAAPTPVPTAENAVDLSTTVAPTSEGSGDPVTQRGARDNVIGGNAKPATTTAQRKAGQAKYKKPSAYTGAKKTKEQVKQIIKDYFDAKPSRKTWSAAKKIAFIKKMKAKYM